MKGKGVCGVGMIDGVTVMGPRLSKYPWWKKVSVKEGWWKVEVVVRSNVSVAMNEKSVLQVDGRKLSNQWW